MATADDDCPNPVQSRFTDASEDEINNILTNINAKNTNKSTKFAVKLLKDYYVSKNRNADFESLTVTTLSSLLKEFYINVRNQSGELYTRSSFLVIRQSLNRHLRSPAVGKTFDIVSGVEFNDANAAFRAMCKKMRQEGKGKIQHKPTIQQGDIKKLYDHPRVFNTDTPSGLLNKVFFETILYFCRRGQENLRDMKPSDFEEKTDDNGKTYICKITSELTKNHQGVDAEDFEPEGGRMYATDSTLCPVASFKKYLDKRNYNCPAMWQRPKDGYDEEDSWYENKPLGINTLAEMMSNISKTANLSKTYSNHCIRATCITLLNDAGFEGRHIVTVSGHRSEESLKNYCSDTSDQQKRNMSESISVYTNVNDTSSSDQTNPKPDEVEFDNSISENELVLTASQADDIMNDIVEGQAQLQPLQDKTNVPETITIPRNPGQVGPPCSLMFHNTRIAS